MRSAVVLFALLYGNALADIYLHTMRGSNNRLSEVTGNVGNQNRLFNSQNNNNGGYAWGPAMYYYAGSTVNIEWTNQHSCGAGNAHCNLVLQYMCDPALRDGDPTQTQPLTTINPTLPDLPDQLIYGRHEPIPYYNLCATRTRNTRLFTADQNLNGNTARYTRQQPGGNQYGTECPEERDYYPYWAWTPWKDIAVITDNTSLCSMYKKESQNVASRGDCSNPVFNNQFDCSASGAQWSAVDSWGIDPPECIQASWTRDNHLGNSLYGQMFSYNWTVPDELVGPCALRIRYNITTGDYDGWGIDASNNTYNSPIQNNPTVSVGAASPLTLNINTAQFGRTFQDRSYQFTIKARPNNVPSGAKIYNLNVRGKRGNIVQVYPSVEYDFVPNRLHVTSGDFIHIQWTGSDYNPTNYEGNGTPGTDRSNIVQILDWSKNIPVNISADGSALGARAYLQNLATLGQTDPELDGATTPYFDGGLIQMTPGDFYYMCTRNNDFSNRSQKGAIFVASMATKVVVSGWALLLIIAFTV